jgi:hypothetical protein
MSKAEDLSKQYKDFREQCGIKDPVMLNEIEEAYFEGYNQAEKDSELTWEDIRIILDAENDIIRECNSQKKLVIVTYPKGEDYYGEILKRFKEMKDNESK